MAVASPVASSDTSSALLVVQCFGVGRRGEEGGTKELERRRRAAATKLVDLYEEGSRGRRTSRSSLNSQPCNSTLEQKQVDSLRLG